MKRLTPRFRRWLRYRWRRATIRNPANGQELHRVVTGGVMRFAQMGKKKQVPEIFCLNENRDGMLEFLRDFRKRMALPMRGTIRLPKSIGAKIPRLGGYYDFSMIKKITPSAALVFASEMDRMRRLSGRPLYAVDPDRWNPEVLRTLRDIGFFSLLEIEPPASTPDDGSIVVLKFRSDTKVRSGEIGGEGSLLADLFSVIEGDRTLRLGLYSAILEAMQNVIDHAYEEQFFHGVRHVKSWWLSAAADRVNRELSVTLYDQGITIPVSLPYRQGLKLVGDTVKQMFGLTYQPLDPKYDAAAIEAAVQLSATSTGKDYHGKGLSTMRDIVTACQKGRLRIMSRHGDFELQSGGSSSTALLPTPLEGTLIDIRAAF